jgi:hypothetical protein
MPKIPQYEQGQLASSLVGTPGVDTSGAAAFGAASKALGGVADTAYFLLKEKQTKLEALQKEQKAAYDAMEVAQHQFKIDSVLDNRERTAKETYVGDPDKGVSDLEVGGLADIKKYADGIEDPKIRASVYAQSLNRHRERVGSMKTTWAGTAKIDAGKGKFASMADALTVEAGQTSQVSIGKDPATGADILKPKALDPVEAYKKIQGFGEAAKPFEFVYGSELPAVVRKQQEAAAESYLSTLAYTNPDQLEAVVESGAFNEFIDGKTRNEMYQKVKQYAREEKTLQMEKEKLARTRATLQIGAKLEKLRRSDATAADYDALAGEGASLGLTPAQTNAIRASGTAAQRSAQIQQTREQKEAQRLKTKAAQDAAKTRVNAAVGGFTAFEGKLKATALNRDDNAIKALDDLQRLSADLIAADIAHHQAYGYTSPIIANKRAKVEAYTVGIKNNRQLKRQIREVEDYQKQMAPPRFSNNPKVDLKARDLYNRSLLHNYRVAKEGGKAPNSTANRQKVRNALTQQINAMIRAGQIK